MQQITQSTFKHSNAIRALIVFHNKIKSGHTNTLPIEQQIACLYSGDVLVNSIMDNPESYTTDELIFVLGMTELINSEVGDIIQDPSTPEPDDINWGVDFHEGA